MKNTLLTLCSIMILGLSLQATAGLSGPPKNVGGSVFRFSDLKPIYQAGLPTNEAILKGTWKLVATATTAACSSLGPDAYDANGIKNSDGSISRLEFLMIKKTVPPGSAEPETQVFSVKLLNYSGNPSRKNQGPYAVDPNEPQFSQWAYKSDGGGLTTDAYLSYSCRIANSKPDTLICSLKLVIANKSDYAQDTFACANDNDFSEILVYTRQ